MKKPLAIIIVVLSLTALLTGCGKPSFVGTYEGIYPVLGSDESEVIMVIERDGSIYREEHYRPIGKTHINPWRPETSKKNETPKMVAEPFYGTWRKISDNEIVAMFNGELNIEPLTITLSSDGKMIIVESQVPLYKNWNYHEYLDRVNKKVQKLNEIKELGEAKTAIEPQTSISEEKDTSNTEPWNENLHHLEFRILEDNPSKEKIKKMIDALEYRVADTYGYLDLGDNVSRKDIYIGLSELATFIIHGLPEEVYYQLQRLQKLERVPNYR